MTERTEHPTREGTLSCAAVMDASSRLIVGWSIADHMRTELVVDALGMATRRQHPDGDATIPHSDHGTPYTSWAFGQRLRAAGSLPSMGTLGDRYDTSMTESFRGTPQLDVLDTRTWDTRDKLTHAIVEWTECWYNTERRHSSPGILRPVESEALSTDQPSTQDDH